MFLDKVENAIVSIKLGMNTLIFSFFIFSSHLIVNLYLSIQ